MYKPGAVDNKPLTWDNSKLIAEISNLLNMGDYYYNSGQDHQAKSQGIKLIYDAMTKIKTLTQRTTGAEQQHYQKILDERSAQYKQQLEYIKNLETQTQKQKAMVMTSGGGQKDEKSEDSKFKSALESEIVTEKPNVKWTDIAGLEVAKKSLQEAVILPIRFPQIFDEVRKPWKGILLYGPPGTGKTFLAKACATEADATFFSISSSSLVSKYVGETEKMIKALFGLARERKPSIIFIDECDSLFTARSDNENEASRRAKTEFLTQMQGVGRDDQGILVLGATNIPWALDSAIRRRFEKRIYIPLPDLESRKYQIELNLKKTKHSLTPDNIKYLAEKTNGYSGSDIAVFIKDAVMQPVRLLQETKVFRQVNDNGTVKFMPIKEKQRQSSDIPTTMNEISSNQLFMPLVDFEDFKGSLEKCKPSVNQALLVDFEKWTKEFGQDG